MSFSRARCLALLALFFATSCASTEEVGRLEQSEWDLVGLDEGGTELRLLLAVGSRTCNEREHLAVTESPSEVRVALTIRSEEHQGCADDLYREEAIVVLDEPLGDRALVGCRPRVDSDDRAQAFLLTDLGDNDDCRAS